MYREKNWRSILKTLTWTLTGTITTFFLVLLFGLQLKAATALALVELIVRFLLYYLHERVYNKLNFGKEAIAPFILWFTGLPESGKTTLAYSVYNEMLKLERKVEFLDGGNVREIIPSLGFSKEERTEHIQRIGFMSSNLVKNNIIVIASFISPYNDSRQFIRNMTNNFVEIYVNTPLEVCEQRDSKGFYKKARKGEIPNFTGINDPYEEPENPEIILSTEFISIDDNTQTIVSYLQNRNFI